MSLLCYRSQERSRILPGSSSDGSAAHRPFYLFVNYNSKCEALNSKLNYLTVWYIVSYLYRMALWRRKHKKMYLLWHVSHFVWAHSRERQNVLVFHFYTSFFISTLKHTQNGSTESWIWVSMPPFLFKNLYHYSLGSFPPKSLFLSIFCCFTSDISPTH